VVARDHTDPDAGLAALGDRGLGLRARRVDDTDHREQGQIAHLADQIVVGVECGRIQIPLGDHHDPLAGGGDAVVRVEGE
jgi:hypothetical protein